MNVGQAENKEKKDSKKQRWQHPTKQYQEKIAIKIYKNKNVSVEKVQNAEIKSKRREKEARVCHSSLC